MANNSLLVPFLDQSGRYCRGVELGLQVLAPMFRRRRVIKGFFLSHNEEQIRLAAHRLGYEVVELEPWLFENKRTGWVWMKLVRLLRS